MKKSGIMVDLEYILSIMPGHVYWKDKDGVYLGCNLLQAQDFGFNSPEEVKGKTDAELLGEEDAAMVRKNDCAVIQSGQIMTLEENSVSSGKTIVYLTKKVPIRDDNDNIVGVLGISFDITASKKQVSDQLEMLEKIISLMPGHVYWKNTDCVLQGCNENQARDAGLSSRKEIIGKTAYDLLWQDQPEKDKQEQAAITDKIDRDVMQSRVKKTIEEFIVLPDHSKAFVLSEKVPLINEDGKVMGLVGISLDITERKQMEQALREAEANARAQEARVKATQAMASGIAHELKTPLSAVIAASSGIKKLLPKLVEAYEKASEGSSDLPFIQRGKLKILEEVADHVYQESTYAASVLEMLLTAVRAEKIDTSKFESLSVVSCIRKAFDLYSYRDEQEKSLIHFDEKNDFHFMGDEKLIINILFNLLKNAFHFIAKARKGDITIWMENKKDYNELHFKDTGSGVSPEDIDQIFDDFFSRRELGTGIGLSFCKRSMKSFGGDIACRSKEGEYTEFVLTFPIK